ncbi:MAG: hypothetical protein R2771_01640 [Saprospiraceae bacterium]
MIEDSPGLTEKILLLKDELRPYTDLAYNASKTIIDNDISIYPIIIAHQDQINVGIPLLNKDDGLGEWSLNASTLEEFYTKNLIEESKLEDFKKLYKLHQDEICYFVLSEIGAQFLFIPIIK